MDQIPVHGRTAPRLAPLTLLIGLLLTATLPSLGAEPGTAGGWIGISVQDVTREIGEAMGLPSGGGALVSDVIPDSPAERAGVRAGDVITQIDAEKVSRANDIVTFVQDKQPGTEVTLHIMRDKEEKTIPVTLGEPSQGPGEAPAARNPGTSAPGRRWRERGGPPASERPMPGMPMEARSSGWRLGVRVNPLDRDLAPYFHAEAGHGVLVLGVLPGSAAAAAGVLSGDVIIKLNKEEITDPRSLRDRVRSMKEGEAFTIEVLRTGRINLLHATLTGAMSNPMPGRIRRPERTAPPTYGWNQRREMIWGHNQLQALEREMRELRRKIEDLAVRIDQLRQDRMR